MLDLYSDHIEGGNSVVKDVANVYDVHIIATGAVISLSRSITLVLTSTKVTRINLVHDRPLLGSDKQTLHALIELWI